MAKLTVAFVRTSKQGKHLDGDGLMLIVSKTGRRRWAYRYQLRGNTREMGLGSFPDVTLAEARELAAAARKLARSGTDPIDHRSQSGAVVPTFGKAAAEYIKAHSTAWTPHYAQVWESSLQRFAAPIADARVDELTIADALGVLSPIWTTNTVTAGRVRQRCECVLDAAIAQGHRTELNPFRWKSGLKHLLPAVRSIQPVQHYAAVHYNAVPALFHEIPNSIPGMALRLTILTACRAKEVSQATWSEIDLDAKLWVIPASRTKQRRTHRVPLSDQAVELLEQVPRIASARADWIFGGAHRDKPINHDGMRRVLKRIRPGFTVHGFRSAFRDWAAEKANFPPAAAELSLGHAVGDQTERSYLRGDMLDKRREMMQEWGRYCAPGKTAKVVPIRRRTT